MRGIWDRVKIKESESKDRSGDKQNRSFHKYPDILGDI